MVIENVQIAVANYKVLSTGADGGHKYIYADVFFHEDKKRSLAVFFASKQDEEKLVPDTEITLKSRMTDEGHEQLTLFDAVLLAK